MTKPPHLDPGGAPRMVDVGNKPVTARRAVASATVRMHPETLATLVDAGGPKGDAFVTARLAGIAAGKRTWELIPLCHPLPIDLLEVELSADRDAGTVTIVAEAHATARTGVEMEALTAASVAALTLYDMAKGMQRDIIIERVGLVAKEGGRSGSYFAADMAAERARTEPAMTEPAATEPARAEPARAEHEALVITCSNRSAAGERPDASGPALVELLREAGFDVAPEPIVVADDEARIAGALAEAVAADCRLVITTGGTGLAPTDVTPAATRRVIEREVPGLAELMRAAGARSTPRAALSRGVAGTRGRTLILNLPGSPGGASESLAAVLPALRHAIDQLAGGDH